MAPHLEEVQKYADVIVDVPTKTLDKSFQYLVPSYLQEKIEVGSVVVVPFHNTFRVGYVVSLSTTPLVKKISPILEILEESAFNQEMVELCQFISNYYLSTLGEALKLVLPPGRTRYLYQEIILEKARLNSSKLNPVERKIVEEIKKEGGKISLRSLIKKFERGSFPVLRRLLEKEVVKREYKLARPKVDVFYEKYVKLKISPERLDKVLAGLAKKAPKQEKILKVLSEAQEISLHELLSQTSASLSSAKSLVRRGFIEIFESPTFREPDFSYIEKEEEPIELTEEQKKSVEIIKKYLDKGRSEVFLLQGVTGSGKTEVYLRAISEVLRKGKSAIVLVPEIALTPQTVYRFRKRFGEIVAVLHSGLGLGERFDQWQKIKEGLAKVVVGARSALFAPVKNLGLIVVDEEHETTYKQNKDPRYHARDVAIKRAAINRACVILGSATPSIESKAKAEKGEYILLKLPRRIKKRKLPEVEIVDMRKEKLSSKKVFSEKLRTAISKALEDGGKVIIFLNRRGFSSFLLCRSCGFTFRCRRCAVSLTYHREERLLKCHHCDYRISAPSMCPSCGGVNIGYFGVGTQRVESELKEIFLNVPVVRMDRDTTLRRGAHRKKLVEFGQKEKGILLGTQMIAKGLDFPEVTLVGVVNADTSLNLPDFRGSERTFQLLMQVSGRAGRGRRLGKVIIQTYLPESYAISSVVEGDYDTFYEKEIEARRELNYPPFSELINILISGKDEERVVKVAVEAGKILAKEVSDAAEILGPAPAPLWKIKNRYRWHILLKLKGADKVKNFLRTSFRGLLRKKGEDITISFDVDPQVLL